MSEEEMNQASAPEETSIDGTLAFQVAGDTVNINGSLVGAVSAGQNASASNSLALAVMAGANATVENGFSGVMMVGHNAEMTNSGAGVVVAGGNVEIHNGGGGVMVCQQASVENGTVNVLLANHVELGEGARVLFSTRQAAAFGAAFGLVSAVMALIFRRRR